MATDKSMTFTRLADGTLRKRRKDGSFQSVKGKTDRDRLARLTDADIERMAASDPDHPALDDAFWRSVDVAQPKEAISIKLDKDVLAFFREPGRGYQTRINTVLRRYMQASRKAG